MKPQNPATWFIGGSTQSTFSYTPGRFMWSIIFNAGGHIPFSFALRANSVTHVKKIVREMITFRAQCIVEYPEAASRRDKVWTQLAEALDGKVPNHARASLEISRCPEDFIYNVAWASNDTFPG